MQLKEVVAFVGLSLALTGCVGMTGGEKGALGGAVTGAGAGAIVGGIAIPGFGAAPGAVVGAAGGAILGALAGSDTHPEPYRDDHPLF